MAPIYADANDTFYNERAAYLNEHPEELQKLLAIASATQAASMTLLFNPNSAPPNPQLYSNECGQGTVFCGQAASWAYNLTNDALAAVNSGPLNGTTLKFLFNALVNSSGILAPYSIQTITAPNAYNITPPKSDIYSTATDRTVARGNITGQYTRLFVQDGALANFYYPNGTLRTPVPPMQFKKILALGNGLCGSSCDTFSR